MVKNTTRPDKTGSHRTQYESNKRKILKTQSICGICGQPVDKKLKYPDPMCGVIDHIIPINKNGHPSDINNLQLAHMCCNRQKSDKLIVTQEIKTTGQKDNLIITNRNLPQITNWWTY